MKNKKILGGLAVVAVLLPGTTVLYIAGVERAGVTSATVVFAEGGDEPFEPVGPCGGIASQCVVAGGFCANNLGTDGGCNPRDCCPPGSSWCPGWNYRQPGSFQEIGSPAPGSHGSCWTYDSTTSVYCNEKYCDSHYTCDVYCVSANPAFPIIRNPPVPLQASCACNEAW